MDTDTKINEWILVNNCDSNIFHYITKQDNELFDWTLIFIYKKLNN